MLFASDNWPRNGPLISPCITQTFEPLQMWCPPTDCKILANPYTGTGFVGARRSFAFCYNPATNATTSAVWTGFLTNVTPPAGWAEEPADCTLQEYSQCNTDGDYTLPLALVMSSHLFILHIGRSIQRIAPSDCNSDGCHDDECVELRSGPTNGWHTRNTTQTSSLIIDDNTELWSTRLYL